jgi:hypothetical protein
MQRVLEGGATNYSQPLPQLRAPIRRRDYSCLDEGSAALDASRAAPPVIRLNADGEPVLVYNPVLKTDLEVYGVWLKTPVIKETGAGELSLWVDCAAPHCSKATGFKLATVKDPNPNLGNFLQHATMPTSSARRPRSSWRCARSTPRRASS